MKTGYINIYQMEGDSMPTTTGVFSSKEDAQKDYESNLDDYGNSLKDYYIGTVEIGWEEKVKLK